MYFKTANCNPLSSRLAFTPTFCIISQYFTCCMQIMVTVLCLVVFYIVQIKLLQMSMLCSRWAWAAGIIFLINKLRLMPAAPAYPLWGASVSLGFTYPITSQLSRCRPPHGACRVAWGYLSQWPLQQRHSQFKKFVFSC
jgi:hypothetical protein